MALFAGESTAWEDIQVKMGNLAARDPKSPCNEERFKETMQRAEGIAKQDFVDSLLTQVAQEPTTEDFDLVALRKARLEQLMKRDSQATVRRITKESYMDEVTVGSKRAIIVVTMDRGGGSSFLESSCRKFAKEWISEIAPGKGFDGVPVRFYIGDVDDLIGTGFPADSLPFAVMYSEGVCQSQLPRATTDGIRNELVNIARAARTSTARSTEPRDDDEDPLDRDIRREIALRRAAEKEGGGGDESEDDYHRSKGYSSTCFEKNVLRFR